jgi:hypothetical protein
VNSRQSAFRLSSFFLCSDANADLFPFLLCFRHTQESVPLVSGSI